MTTTIAEAIQSLKPGSEFSFTNDNYSTIKWDVLEGSAPTEKQIKDEIKRLDKLKLEENEIKLNAQIARASAISKLGEIAGLTKEEINAIL